MSYRWFRSSYLNSKFSCLTLLDVHRDGLPLARSVEGEAVLKLHRARVQTGHSLEMNCDWDSESPPTDKGHFVVAFVIRCFEVHVLRTEAWMQFESYLLNQFAWIDLLVQELDEDRPLMLVTTLRVSDLFVPVPKHKFELELISSECVLLPQLLP